MADTLYNQAVTTDLNGYTGYTWVQKWGTADLTLPSYSIAQMRVTFTAAATEGLTITNAYIGHVAASGNAYDFLATPAQLLFAGSGGVAIGIGATATSDWAYFTYNKTSALLVAFYINGGPSVDTIRYVGGLSATIINYTSPTNEAAVVVKTAGYTVTPNVLVVLTKVESQPSGGFFF